MSKHATPDEPVVESKRKLFSQHNMPHVAWFTMLAVWMYFQIKLGTEGVPPVLNQSFAVITGLWFSFLTRESLIDDKKEK